MKCCNCLKLTGTVTGTTFPATLTLTGPNNKVFYTDINGNYSQSFKLRSGDYILSVVGGIDYAFTKNKCNQCVSHDFDIPGMGEMIFGEQFVNEFV